MLVAKRLRASQRARVMVLALAALAVVVATGCGSDDGGGADGDVTGVTVVVPTPSVIAMYPYYVAREQGYFREHGLDVTINSVDGSPQTIQAAASGATDVWTGSTTEQLRAAGERSDFHPVMFYRDFIGSPLGVAAPTDADIATPADLEGKRIGVSALSAIESVVAKGLAAGAGLNPEQDIELRAVGDGGQALVALERGDIDAYAGGIADIAIISARGIDMQMVMPPEDRDPLTLGMWAKREYIEGNPEVIRKFSAAITEALESIGADTQKLVDFATELNPAQTEDAAVTEELAKTSIALHTPPEGVPLGHIPPEDWQRRFGVANDQGQRDDRESEACFTNEHTGTASAGRR